ncbi:GTP cyclohydrolase [Nocardia alni]|uniref:GTP cyclohydrolase n=1 Tax=Nocardia alni TaxID=2815723 RepID=UPI001C22B51A|nr:GTP cyclohydrolase [Nocardia alni]
MWNTFAVTSHEFSRKGHRLRIEIAEVPVGRGHLLIFGSIGDGCLVRIHSRCLYGESLGGDDCDCGSQLDQSLDLIAADGAGVLVYLEQEGRGYGLIAKARGNSESERTGLDTFASYESLGYDADARSYTEAAQALSILGLTSVQLLTNNPAKMRAVTAAGIGVTVVPIRTRPRTVRAQAYLDAERRRGHWIPTDDPPWAMEFGPPANGATGPLAGHGHRRPCASRPV